MAGLASIGMGLVTMVYGAASKQRKAVCPFCGKEQRVIKSVDAFLCGGCGAIFRTLGGKSEEIVKVYCPQCQAPWAGPAECAALPCYVCGAQVEGANGQARLLPPDAACPGCGQPVAKSASYCGACGTLITEPYLGGPYYNTLQQMFRESPVYDDPYLNAMKPASGMNKNVHLLTTRSASWCRRHGRWRA